MKPSETEHQSHIHQKTSRESIFGDENMNACPHPIEKKTVQPINIKFLKLMVNNNCLKREGLTKRGKIELAVMLWSEELKQESIVNYLSVLKQRQNT